ncbi:MAG: DUF58 domain-containing protein [Verrucomicrobiae bacterium]|nr:DUF58 domain-containing protein [Verrucomicrobiae bacterium]
METAPSAPRLTLSGTVAIAATVTLILGGLALLSPSLLASGLCGALLILAARLLAARHLRGFTVERELPRRARAGESFPMELMLRPGPAFPGGVHVHITDSLAPILNAREFSPDPSRRITWKVTGLTHRRGPLVPRPWMITSTWPLGLFLTEARGLPRDLQPLLVHPRPWLPPALEHRLEELSLEAAERPFETPDPLSEFRLLREFRNGDAVRGIHWPTSLRTGRLQVAETERPRPKPNRYGILLHSHETPGSVVTPESFELVLRIATGLLLRFQRDEIPLIFSQAPFPPVSLKGRSDFSRQLDSLAHSRRQPLRGLQFLENKAGKDPFEECDEVFVIGDSPLEHWEEAAHRCFSCCTCLDPGTLTSRSRPGLRTIARHSP